MARTSGPTKRAGFIPDQTEPWCGREAKTWYHMGRGEDTTHIIANFADLLAVFASDDTMLEDDEDLYIAHSN